MNNSQKLEVISLIKKDNNLTNKEVSEVVGVSASQVSSVRYWHNKKGVSYEESLRVTLDKANNLYKVIQDKFKNKGGLEKQKAREVMVNWIANSNTKKGKILTLPCSDWNIEKMVNENVSKKFSYVACERDVETLVKMTQKMHLYGVKNEVYHGNIGDKMLSASENEYEHIIADYCGGLHLVKKELMYACTNNIVKVGGTIAVTLFKARNENSMVSKLNQFKSDMTGSYVRQNDNESAIKMFFHSLASITDFEVVQEFCYGDTSPMILIVLKRTK